MPLDEGYADRVAFECEGCGHEHSLRQVRKGGGVCAKCQSDTWVMVTEYNEAKHAHGILPMLLHVVFGIETLNRNANTIRVATPSIPADEALTIAKASVFKYQRMAFRYMELRRDLDGKRDRQIMREQGGGNCAICGMFFMPSSEKPWTQAGCCSKACFAKTEADTNFEMEATQKSIPAESANAPRTVAVACRCGLEFQASTMYLGVLRACPRCGEKTIVRDQ